jgi:hypothetical protein
MPGLFRYTTLLPSALVQRDGRWFLEPSGPPIILPDTMIRSADTVDPPKLASFDEQIQWWTGRPTSSRDEPA